MNRWTEWRLVWVEKLRGRLGSGLAYRPGYMFLVLVLWCSSSYWALPFCYLREDRGSNKKKVSQTLGWFLLFGVGKQYGTCAKCNYVLAYFPEWWSPENVIEVSPQTIYILPTTRMTAALPMCNPNSASPCFHVNYVYPFYDLPHHCNSMVALFQYKLYIFKQNANYSSYYHIKILSENFLHAVTYASKALAVFHFPLLFLLSSFFLLYLPLIIPGPYQSQQVVFPGHTTYGSPKASRCRYANFPQFLVDHRYRPILMFLYHHIFHAVRSFSNHTVHQIKSIKTKWYIRPKNTPWIIAPALSWVFRAPFFWNVPPEMVLRNGLTARFHLPTSSTLNTCQF